MTDKYDALKEEYNVDQNKTWPWQSTGKAGKRS